jgi:chromosome segregation ATPase
MDWLIIFAGSTITLLGAFLLVSERELGRVRRGFEELRRKQAGTPSELMARNKALTQEISSLSTRLEESQRAVEQSDLRFSEAATHNQELAQRSASLQTEIAQLKQQQQASQETLEELQTAQQRLLDAQSESQKVRSENQHLRQEVANLRNELQTNKSLLGTAASRYKELINLDSRLQSELAGLRPQVDKLALTNKERLEEIDSLSRKLAASQRTVEQLQTVKEQLSGAQSENQQLHAVNRELQHEIANIKNDLQNNATRLKESAREAREMTEHNSTLQTEVADLKQQLEESRAKAKKLEALEQQLANSECHDVTFRDQQKKLEAQIVDLQRELSAGKETMRELDAARRRLAEIEHVSDKLRAENRRLEEEILRLQERLADSERDQKQFSTLRQQLDDIRTKQALLVGDGRFQNKLAAVGKLIDRPSRRGFSPDPSAALPATTPNVVELSPETSLGGTITHELELVPGVCEVNSPTNGSSERSGHFKNHMSMDRAAVAGEAQEIKPAALRNWKWRLGIVPVTVVLAITAAGAMGFLSRSSNKFSASKGPAVALESGSGKQGTSSETLPRRQAPESETGETQFSTQTGGLKPAPRLRGSFKITRPTEVYSGPSEHSSLITSIEPGTKINVVDPRGGWLEIRSKFGRPPGFVRQDAAVRD